MINPQGVKEPMSRANVYGPKDVLAIEVRLYTVEVLESLKKKSATSFIAAYD